jgi:pantothenate kinase-related protein Tda10
MEGTFGRENLSLQFAAPLFMFLENLIIVIAMHASTRTQKKKNKRHALRTHGKAEMQYNHQISFCTTRMSKCVGSGKARNC